jgi:hypothetical protein
MKISFLYSKIVVLKNCVRNFLFISSFRWYGDFFDDCNIFLNRLRSELLLIIKISKIRRPKLCPVKIWEKFVKTRRRITRLKISNCRKMFREKIEFEYYIFNVFLIAAKCILLNNSARFQHFSFKLCQIVGMLSCFHALMETTKKILGKINTQRCSVL